MAAVRSLFTEYAGSLGIDLSFQGFDRELEELPGKYSPSEGALLIAEHDGKPCGCIALRRIDGRTCEMKRLYVQPACRGLGIGRELVSRLVEEARAKGYSSMRLDTLPSMRSAIAMCRSFGFQEIAPYIYNPVEGGCNDITRACAQGLKKSLGITSGANKVFEPYQMFDGTEVQVSGHFEYDVQPDGSIVQYPGGDRSAPPSGRMPKDGFYFDAIVRQEPIDEAALDPREWVEQTYSPYSEEDLRFLETESARLYRDTPYSLIGNFGGGGFGDIANVPAAHVPRPKGIRDPEEWYVSMITRRGYIEEIFRLQLELQMKNLECYRQAVGDRIDVIVISSTDFGSQNGPFISPQAYREIFKPLHKTMNDWVHAHTPWKTFFHSCGSIVAFFDDFAEAGVDVLNPVQISAAGIAPESLKEHYGDRFVFWGGAVDAQHTFAFSTPDQVREEAQRNIQATVPTENIVALFEAARERGSHR